MAPISTSEKILGLIVCLIITFTAAAIGGAASVEAGGFYEELRLPSWAPPAFVFGPVWAFLYTVMGIAAWLVWKARGVDESRTALSLFLLQLAFNALWSWLFFGWNLGGWAFVEIIVLWTLIAATMVTFWKVRTGAGILMVPYLLWVTFAAILNFSVWRMNPEML